MSKCKRLVDISSYICDVLVELSVDVDFDSR